MGVMPRKRFAIITFDPDRVAALNWQGEGNNFAYAIWRGLRGFTYAKERGLENITVMDRVTPIADPADASRVKRPDTAEPE